MNKIIIEDDKILQKELDKSIKINEEEKPLDVNTIKIDILKDTNLSLDFKSKKTSLKLIFDIAENTRLNLYEYKKGQNNKFGYIFNLKKNSYVNYIKLNDLKNTKENLVFNMNGTGSKLDYHIKTICTSNEQYDLMVYHNYSNTTSNIYNNGVDINDGVLKFHVSGFIPKGKKGCNLSHNNRIINLTDNICEIKPKLFIDENDVIANHSAHIGRCPDDEIFYMRSRGLTLEKAENLWIRGFLLNDMPTMEDKIEKMIKKYWRW